MFRYMSLFLEGEGSGGGGPGDGGAFGTGVSIDEMETQLKAAEEKPKEEPKPDAATSAFEAALRISEDARQRAEAALRAVPAPAPVINQPAPPDAIEMLTDEQLAKIIEEKGPVAGARAIQAQLIKLQNRHLDERLAGIHGAGTQAAENAARAKYPVEFELFGDEIKSIVAGAPDKSALANQANWDNMIAYVRGKEGNIQKYTEKLSKGASDKAAETAREQQRGSAGVHAAPAASTGASATPGPDGYYGLDATQREIADKMGRTYADYAKWSKVGN